MMDALPLEASPNMRSACCRIWPRTEDAREGFRAFNEKRAGLAGR